MKYQNLQKVVGKSNIEDLLRDKVIIFDDGAKQIFNADGTTVYDEGGRQSPGTWEAKEEVYCSVWPPSSYVACYEFKVLVESDQVIGVQFIDTRNKDVFTGKFE